MVRGVVRAYIRDPDEMEDLFQDVWVTVVKRMDHVPADALIKKWLAELEAAKPELAGYIRQAVEIAVLAAEQMEIGGFIEDKKQYALNIAQAYLNEHGWDEFDIDVLEAAIEAEVLKQFPK
jgi:DNA-directed RNA polymerase specialized sigma24 family protein